MENKKIEVCRLCLLIKSYENYIYLENWNELLKTVIPKNINISADTKICSSCNENLIFCYGFKKRVIESRKNFIKLEWSNRGFEHNLESTSVKPEVNNGVCWLCLENCNNLATDPAYLKMMLDTCFSEFDKPLSHPVSCTSCLESLEKAFTFIMACLESENNIQEFRFVNDKKFNEDLNLFEVTYFLLNRINMDIDLSVSEGTFEDKTVVKQETNFERDDIKGEVKESYPLQHDSEQSLPQETAALPVVENKYKCNLCQYTASHNYKMKRHSLIHKDKSEISMFRCEECYFETRHKSHFNRHILKHKAPSEKFKCDLCTYESIYKEYYQRHILAHPEFKCNICTYKTYRKLLYDKHLLIHKDFSEITVYECDKCTFKTKVKDRLKQHRLVHSDPSEITMFKCNECNFETKRKTGLKVHMKVHRKLEELPVYNCEKCSFTTRRKESIGEHLLTHKSSSELVMFKCDICSYEAKMKKYLARHMMVHKSPAKVPMFKCESCSYKTKYKKHLKRHAMGRRCMAKAIKRNICSGLETS